MPLHSFLAHIDRDDRHRARIAAGERRALPPRGHISHVGRSRQPHQAWIKPKGFTVPNGAVVIAVRRDIHDRCTLLMVETFEGDAAAFAAFPRLAQVLGATELHLSGLYGTMLERCRIETDLSAVAPFARADLLARPLCVAGAFDRSAIMATACAAAKARQTITGEAGRPASPPPSAASGRSPGPPAPPRRTDILQSALPPFLHPVPVRPSRKQAVATAH